MTRLRRSALLLVLTVAVVLGAALPANALFTDTAAPTVKPAIGTLTVTGPGNVRVDTSCTTTTTVVKSVYNTIDNSWVSTTQTSSTADSGSNVESDTTVRTDDTPVVGQYTLTRTIKDTTLFATARWNRSNSPGVTGYRMTVFFANGLTYPMDDVPASSTSMADSYDADVVDLGARLSMVTLTSYGWTAPGNMSNVVRC
jgi:hypothetical protein